MVDARSEGRDRRPERQSRNDDDDRAMTVLFVWLMWFAITCVLTLAGILVIAGASIVYLIGAGIEKVRPRAGRSTMSAAPVRVRPFVSSSST